MSSKMDHLARRYSSMLEAKKKWKSNLEKIAYSSDVHGAPELYEAKRKESKFAWIFILIIVFLILSFEIYRSFMDFIENPVITSHNFKTDLDQLRFPEVYICPSNPIHESTWRELNIDPEWEKAHIDSSDSSSNLDGILAQKTSLSESFARLFPSQKTTFIDPHINPPENFSPRDCTEFYRIAGYPLDTFIEECSFNSEHLNCKEIVTAVIDPDYGKCFLIRVNQSQAVAGVGLSLVLNLDMKHGYPDGSSNHEPPLFDAFIMKVGHKLDMGSQKKTLLFPGTYTKASMEATRISLIEKVRLGNQKKLCNQRDDHILKIFNHRYTKSICQLDCVYRTIYEQCSCLYGVDSAFLNPQNTTNWPRYCSVMEQRNCAKKALTKNVADIRHCAQKCLPACKFWNFRVETTQARFPSARFEKLKKQGPIQEVMYTEEEKNQRTEYEPPQTLFVTPPAWLATTLARPERGRKNPLPFTNIPSGRRRGERSAEDDKNEIVNKWMLGDRMILDIAFSSLEFIEIKQEHSMTFTSLVGNIGGQVGLWIGCSIVSVVKLFAIIIPLFWRYCQRCCFDEEMTKI